MEAPEIGTTVRAYKQVAFVLVSQLLKLLSALKLTLKKMRLFNMLI